VSPTAEQLIGDLVHRYADAVTRRDVPRWADCWTEDACWELRADRVARGRAAIVDQLERALATLEGVVQSVLHGSVRVEGGKATGRWSLSEHYRRVGGEAGLLLFAYDDTYLEREGRWLFGGRTLVPSYVGPPDLSGTFHFSVGAAR
jgi:hypothetical protein